jgi:hypothetical protein
LVYTCIIPLTSSLSFVICSVLVVLPSGVLSQLGLGHTTSQATPTLLQLPLAADEQPVAIATGPLAMHSVVVTGPLALTSDRDQACNQWSLQEGGSAGRVSALVSATMSSSSSSSNQRNSMSSLRHPSLPSVTYEKIAHVVGVFKDAVAAHTTAMSTPGNNASIVSSASSKVKQALLSVREMVSAAFSSIAVLNASFLLPSTMIGHGSLCVDLKAVRGAYELLLSTEHMDPLIVTTLGRATLHLADQLKECKVDDAENLSAFLIVLENPLMLRAESFHVAIELVS